MKYKLEIGDGSLGSAEIEADDIECAQAEARDWVARRDWEGPEQYVMCRLTDEAGTRTDVEFVVGGEPEPECGGGGHDWRQHHWLSPREVLGELKENPGVSSAGGTLFITEVCEYCGKYRHTETESTPGHNPRTPERFTYHPADAKSRAWAGVPPEPDDFPFEAEFEAEFEHAAEADFVANNTDCNDLAMLRDAVACKQRSLHALAVRADMSAETIAEARRELSALQGRLLEAEARQGKN